MKICSSCHLPKPLKSFNFRNRSKGTRQHQCKPCHKLYQDRHYAANKTRYIQRASARNARVAEENYAKITAYLEDHPCPCGETDPVVMEFDHNDPTAKTADIGRMITWKWETILKEISKCTVRCANCHRRRTAEQFRWRKWRSRRDLNPQYPDS